MLHRWDAKDHKYKIVVSLKPKLKSESWTNMCFFFGTAWVSCLHPREMIVTEPMTEDKTTTEPTTFIDVNSEHLRDVLKIILL
jgi:hypothetical protein